jgi:hypothetical protein
MAPAEAWRYISYSLMCSGLPVDGVAACHAGEWDGCQDDGTSCLCECHDGRDQAAEVEALRGQLDAMTRERDEARAQYVDQLAATRKLDDLRMDEIAELDHELGEVSWTLLRERRCYQHGNPGGGCSTPSIVAVAVDPSGGGRDTAGIVGGYLGLDGRLHLTHDQSGVMPSADWARAALATVYPEASDG